MNSKTPQYHVIEKDTEVVFYIPYDEELFKLYTKDFFALHNQDADISIIAFHNNDNILFRGGYADEDESKIWIPYKMFHQKAKYIEDELIKRFNNIPKKESSYNLFSNLLENGRRPVIKEPEPESINDEQTRESEPESKEETRDLPVLVEPIEESPKPVEPIQDLPPSRSKTGNTGIIGDNICRS